MARPARPQWIRRSYARRRHRTWIRSMALATAGWCVFWAHVALARFAPEIAPSAVVTTAAMSACGAVGLVTALLTIRAQLAWRLLGTIALLANASLLALPWLAL